jgi:3'-5' exoribonuclease
MTVTPATTLPLAQVRALPVGDLVTGFYLLAKSETRKKKDGNLFLVLTLQDATGTLDGKKWEEYEDFYAAAKIGDAVKVEGRVDFYNNVPSLIVSRIRVATDDEVPDKRLYLPHSKVSAKEALEGLGTVIGTVRNPHLRKLLDLVFGDAEFLARFLGAPGGKKWHHCTVGGLAEHTLSISRLADGVAGLYPDLNRDLLVTGALLHDVGKVFELSTDIAFDYTSEGRLLGHITEGALFVERKLLNIENFPEETRKHVLHLILSHQGDPSMNSPVKPATLEALVLHFCDEIDSKAAAYLRERDAAEGQDFTWINLMQQHFYYKPIDAVEESNEGGAPHD